MGRRHKRRQYARRRGQAPQKNAPPKKRHDWIMDRLLEDPNLSIEGKNGAVALMTLEFGKAMSGSDLHRLRNLAREHREDALRWCKQIINDTPSITISSTEKTRGLHLRCIAKYGKASPTESELLHLQAEAMRNGEPKPAPLKHQPLRDQLDAITRPVREKRIEERLAIMNEAQPPSCSQATPDAPPKPQPKEEPVLPKMFGERLKALREGLGKTFVEMAEGTGISSSTFSLWEKGYTRPSPRMVAKIEEHYPEMEGAALPPQTSPEARPKSSSSRSTVKRAGPSGFGLSLRKHRIKAGLTIRGLAEVLGVRRETLGDWELGKAMPTPSNMNDLIDLFPTLEGYKKAPINGVVTHEQPRSDFSTELSSILKQVEGATAGLAQYDDAIAETAKAVSSAQAKYDEKRQELEQAEKLLAQLQLAHKEAKEAREQAKEQNKDLRAKLVELAQQF